MGFLLLVDLLIKIRKSKYILCILLCFFVHKQAFAVPDTRLWLPKKFIALKPRLKKIAELADQREDCASVIRAELAFSRSKPGLPVFRVVCRNQESLSFAIYSYMDESGEDKLEADEDEEMSLPMDEVIARRLCYIAVRDEAANLIKPKVIVDPDLKPYTNEVNESYFYIEVDAESLSAEPLEFGAVCIIQPDGAYKISLMMRSKMQALRLHHQNTVPKVESLRETVSSDRVIGKEANKQDSITSMKGATVHTANTAKAQSVPPLPKIKSRMEFEHHKPVDSNGWELLESGRQPEAGFRKKQANKVNASVEEGWELQENPSINQHMAAQVNDESMGKTAEKAAPKKEKVTIDGWTVDSH